MGISSDDRECGRVLLPDLQPGHEGPCSRSSPSCPDSAADWTHCLSLSCTWTASRTGFASHASVLAKSCKAVSSLRGWRAGQTDWTSQPLRCSALGSLGHLGCAAFVPSGNGWFIVLCCWPLPSEASCGVLALWTLPCGHFLRCNQLGPTPPPSSPGLSCE